MDPKTPRALARYPLGAKVDGGDVERWHARDRDRGTAVIVSRVRFGGERIGERDALVDRAQKLCAVSAPALVAPLDVGAWDEDAFVVEEAVIEPRPVVEALADLDAREKALAARSLAEGLASLHEAGWSIDALDERDVVIDAYRQPRLAIASRAVRATDASRAADVERLSAIVSRWATILAASSAADLARAVEIPDGVAAPLLRDVAAPGSMRFAWLFLAVALAGIAVLFALR